MAEAYNKKSTEQERNDMMVAEVTGDVYKVNECAECDKEQLFFALKDSAHEFSISLSDILGCLRFAEELGELPPHDADWWAQVKARYQIPWEEYTW